MDSHGPYKRGWPMQLAEAAQRHVGPLKVVPLSDAERMREALESLVGMLEEDGCLEDPSDLGDARAALNPTNREK